METVGVQHVIAAGLALAIGVGIAFIALHLLAKVLDVVRNFGLFILAVLGAYQLVVWVNELPLAEVRNTVTHGRHFLHTAYTMAIAHEAMRGPHINTSPPPPPAHIQQVPHTSPRSTHTSEHASDNAQLPSSFDELYSYFFR
jgi:hypothetical protein